jgi:ligand-binding SRPBCC domain-containing protein
MSNDYVLECELIAPVTIQRAFEVFEDPYNLAKITPPWLNFKILSPEVRMRSGEEIEYRFRWLGAPMYWKTIISAYQPPFYFVDEAVRSPYSYWRHHHFFRVLEGGGTAVADRVEYGLPLGPLGRAAHGAVVGRQLRRIFEFRQRAIGGMLGGAEVRQGARIRLGDS